MQQGPRKSPCQWHVTALTEQLASAMGEVYSSVADVDERLQNRLSPPAFRSIATGSVKTLQPIQGRLGAWVWNTYFNANGLFVTCKGLRSLNLSPAQLLQHLKDNIHTISRTVRLHVDLGEDDDAAFAAVLEEWVLSWANADKLTELSVSNLSTTSRILDALQLRFPALTKVVVAFNGAPGGRWSPSLPPQLTTLDVSDAGDKSITTAVLFDCSVLAPLKDTLKVLRLDGLALDNVSQLARLSRCEELKLSGPHTAEDTDEQRIKIVSEMPALQRAVLPDTTCKPGSWAHLCAATGLEHVELQEVLLLSPDPAAQEQQDPAASFKSLKVCRLGLSRCDTQNARFAAYQQAQQQQRMQQHQQHQQEQASHAMRQAAAAVQALGQGAAWAAVMLGEQAEVLALVQAVQPGQQQGGQQQALQALQHAMQAMLVCTQPGQGQGQGQGRGQGQGQGQGLQAARQALQQAREALQQGQGEQAVQQAMGAMSQAMGQVLDVCRQPAGAQAALRGRMLPSLARLMPNLQRLEAQQAAGDWSMMMDGPPPLHTLLLSSKSDIQAPARGLLAQLPLRDLRLLAPLRGTGNAMDQAQLLAAGCRQVAHLQLKLSLAQAKALFSLLHGNGSIRTLGLSITPEKQQSRVETKLAAAPRGGDAQQRWHQQPLQLPALAQLERLSVTVEAEEGVAEVPGIIAGAAQYGKLLQLEVGVKNGLGASPLPAAVAAGLQALAAGPAAGSLQEMALLGVAVLLPSSLPLVLSPAFQGLRRVRGLQVVGAAGAEAVPSTCSASAAAAAGGAAAGAAAAAAAAAAADVERVLVKAGLQVVRCQGEEAYDGRAGVVVVVGWPSGRRTTAELQVALEQ